MRPNGQLSRLCCLLLFVVTGFHRDLLSVRADEAQPSSATVSESTTDDNGFRVHHVRSEFQTGETLIRVLSPDKVEGGQLCKVLYVLPVEAGTEHRYGDGLTEAKRLDVHNKHNLICVAPTFAQLPWYADHPTDKGIRQESYFVKVVVPTVERLYSAQTQRDGRLLVGFSKSGFGAWTLLLRHPLLFGKAAAWDAPLMKTAPDQFGMGPIYGSAENFQQYRIDCLLCGCATLLRGDSRHTGGSPVAPMPSSRPHHEQPAARLIHLGYGGFRGHHCCAEVLLNELRIPHVYADGPRREHTWHSGWLTEAVRELVE